MSVARKNKSTGRLFGSGGWRLREEEEEDGEGEAEEEVEEEETSGVVWGEAVGEWFWGGLP